ncbi:pseudouridine synthase [Flavihumibacter profundi]|uniref:pseudouridine synthase n=1 Tax=Flavihumibacter profundi TaxID=2716883 RepID=UPI001CC7853C|nr:pseudouridine synthase [Flavihumibacter profundi]MBZ5858025.1 pseudouridine synthase [Flavihumibacter profundi]
MEESGHRYFVLHKPYNMVSQFVSPDNVNLLGQVDFDFPPGTHAIGRLDNHSEGLLLLTTNKKMTAMLFSSAVPHKRDYLVRVRNVVLPEALEKLRQGVAIPVSNGAEYIAKPCAVELVEKPVWLANRPNEYRDDIPHSWLLMTLTEGKFHQVRKMVGAVRHPCQRLVRVAIEDLTLGDLPAGCIRELPEAEIFRLLKIGPWAKPILP